MAESKKHRKVAYVLLLKQGEKPADEGKYAQEVFEALAPEVFSNMDVRIDTRYQVGPVDLINQYYIMGAVMRVLGSDISKKYDIWTEKFTDAEGDRGILVEALYK